MIPFFDARARYESHRREIDAAIQRVLTSGRLILGPEVEAFEHEFAAFVGARAAVGVASGTDALTLALLALGIGHGDEVITVANAGVPTVAAIRAVQATPRFVDVTPSSLLMDPSAIAQAVSPRTRCILPVHLYGQAAPLDALLDIARCHNVPVVEDCAQAHGARYRGQHVGTFGASGCFSFYPTKNLGAFGDGGMCVTNDLALATQLRKLRMYGFSETQEAICEGFNSRLDELQAAVLRVHLAHLPAALEARRAIAERYTHALGDTRLRLPVSDPAVTHAFHLYVVQTHTRPQMIKHLELAGIGYRVHYPLPVHLMEAYGFLGYRRGALPVTEQAADEVLSLPLYPELPLSSMERVIEALCDTSADQRVGKAIRSGSGR